MKCKVFACISTGKSKTPKNCVFLPFESMITLVFILVLHYGIQERAQLIHLIRVYFISLPSILLLDGQCGAMRSATQYSLVSHNDDLASATVRTKPWHLH